MTNKDHHLNKVAVRTSLFYYVEDPQLETHLNLRHGYSLTFHKDVNGDLGATLGGREKGRYELTTLLYKADGPGKASSIIDASKRNNSIWDLQLFQYLSNSYKELPKLSFSVT